LRPSAPVPATDRSFGAPRYVAGAARGCRSIAAAGRCRPLPR